MEENKVRIFDNSIVIKAEAKIVVLNGDKLPKVGSKIILDNIIPEGFDKSKKIELEVKKILDIEKLAADTFIEGVIVTIGGNITNME